MNFKFKVGDKVKVCREKVKIGENYPNTLFFNPNMELLIGRTFTIKSQQSDKSFPTYNFTESSWVYDEEWLELVEKVMEPKYKVGDKVRVVEKVKDRSYQYGFATDMLALSGKIVTITDVRINDYVSDHSDEDGCKYRINEDYGEYSWASSMFEEIEEITPDLETDTDEIPLIDFQKNFSELAVGDRILITNEKRYSSLYHPNQILEIIEVDGNDSDQKYKCRDIDGIVNGGMWIHVRDIIHATNIALSKLFKEKGIFKVKSDYFGIIKVISVSNDPNYPILCELEDGDQILLTDDGKFFNHPNILPII